MENEELNEMIINAYKEYLDGELLEDSIASIDQYVSTLYYDLLDDIELNKELYGIKEDLDDYLAVEKIEDYIEYVLKNKDNLEEALNNYGSNYAIILRQFGNSYKSKDFNYIKSYLKHNTILHLGYGGRKIIGINEIEKYFKNEFDFLIKSSTKIKTKIDFLNEKNIMINEVDKKSFEKKIETNNSVIFVEDNIECLVVQKEVADDIRKFIIIITLNNTEKFIENIIIEKMSFYGLE